MTDAELPNPTPAPVVTQAGPSQPRSGPGCLAKLVFFVGMLVIGGVAAHLIRGNDGPQTVTVAEGRAGDASWTLRGRVDPEDERCLELYQQGLDDALTGGCLPSRTEPTPADFQETTPPDTDRWVLFGPAPAAAKKVRLGLTDGSAETVEVQTHSGWDDAFYLVVPDRAGVHASGSPAFLDASGQPLASSGSG